MITYETFLARVDRAHKAEPGRRWGALFMRDLEVERPFIASLLVDARASCFLSMGREEGKCIKAREVTEEQWNELD